MRVYGEPIHNVMRFPQAQEEKPMKDVIPNKSSQRASDGQPTKTPLFLFATGIENSIPTIQNGRVRRDQRCPATL